MENRPAALRSRRVCRFCLTESEPLSFIYERDQSKPFQLPLTLQIMSCVAIEVYAADGMPQMICSMCRWNVDRSYKFKLQCKKADEALRSYPLSGVLPRPFPPISLEPPDIGNKKRTTSESRSSSIEPSKKPRVDNGSGSGGGGSSSSNNDRPTHRESHQRSTSATDMYEEEVDNPSEDEQDGKDPKDQCKLEPGEIRVHACDQCERTFPLRQALVLHVQRAHRDRNYKCTECERLFFSKYDLAKHMATHSEPKPFSCPICQKQFTRANLLQRHEKVHRDELRYGCQHCEREFLTTEELEKHEEAAHKRDKPYQCNICNKRFTYKQGLERHEMLHSDDKSFVCEYCKEAFRTSTKLARHLTTHAGHRPYLCKLCPRTFLLSHHLTRHMRTHSVEKRHVCEDCGKAFKRKESLDVHQLTHTKRTNTGMGLTCDVCQESCRNRADYVTHIKQHIEAGEKMGPDGLAPDPKTKVEIDSEEEEDEDDDDRYSDGDDDYQPPAYITKKIPRVNKAPSSNLESDEEAPTTSSKLDKDERNKEQIVFVRDKDGNMVKKTIKTLMPIQRRVGDEAKVVKSEKNRDETEAQVQKIVASVFKEHKIPLKTTSEDAKGNPGTPKSVNTVKVIKRIVVRKPGTGGTESVKDNESTTPKVTKRVIVRRIIRTGDTTREVIMNPDGTIIDPAELAKLPTGNVVKRVIVKKPMDKSQAHVQAVLQSSSLEQKGKLTSHESNQSESSKPPSGTSDQETKDRVEQLEKRLEQQRLKIEELQAQKQQHDTDQADDALPERHDESEDEQQLPLKRVFVKRQQSIYDEEKEYNDCESNNTPLIKDVVKIPRREGNKPLITSSRVYENKKIIVVKSSEVSEVEEMNRELNSILETTNSVVKMQENVLCNLTQISSIEGGQKELMNDDKIEETTEIEKKGGGGGGGEEEGVDEPMDDSNIKIESETMEIDPPVAKCEGNSQDDKNNEEETNEETTQDLLDSTNEIVDDTNDREEHSLNKSIIPIDAVDETIQLNDTNDSQDSLEDKLSKMEG